MSLVTVLVSGVVVFYERSNVPLALMCASPRIRWACEKMVMVNVGAWGLQLMGDDSRRVAWRLPTSLERCSVAGAVCSVVWWCNRPPLTGCKSPLMHLDLSTASCLTGGYLRAVFAFRSLVELTLRRAPVEDVNALGKLPMLKRLDLVQARVVDSGIIGLGESRSLMDVNMWGCAALTNVNVLYMVPTLRSLVLSETNICDDGIVGLVGSSSIEVVNLEACALVKNAGFFGKLPVLKRLILVTTQVDNNGIMDLSDSTSLVEIDLWGCVAVDDVNSLGKIPTLRRLDLFGTSVTNEGIVDLGRSNSLEEIDLTCCEAVSDVRELTKIPTLRRLILLHTSVYDVLELFSTSVLYPTSRMMKLYHSSYEQEGSHLAEEERGPTYIHTDLTAMLRDAQSSSIRFAEESHDIISGAANAPSALERTCHLRKLEEAYLGIVKIQAPMVGCSRPAFRKLCRLWGTDVSYTHMIMADSFTRSNAARHAEFSTYTGEDRLVAQIASSSGPVAAEAAVLLAPYCDAIDLNCGCPKRRVMKEGLGSALLQKPEVVADIVHCVRNGLTGGASIPCVVKMRVSDDLRRSVDFARQCEAAGCGWITVHGRTPLCSAHAPVRFDAIRTIRESISVPVVANGGVHDPQTALETALATGVGGVMSGTGLLTNPACFYVQQDSEALHFAPQRRSIGVALEECVEPCCIADAEVALACAMNSVRLRSMPCCPVEVVSDFVRLSCVTDLASKTTSLHLLKMGGNYLSPMERIFVAQMHSSFSVISVFQQLGLYIKEGKFRIEECVL